MDRLASDITQLFAQIGEKAAPEKLGLGSSAASTVALTAACLLNDDKLIDETTRRRIFERAFAAHRSLQDGRGSCADVASSVFGGVLGYRLMEPCEGFSGCKDVHLSQRSVPLSVAEISMCPPLPVRVEPVWLGRPAVSTSFVRRCEEALRAGSSKRQSNVHATLCRTSRLAIQAIEALQTSNPSSLLDLVERADAALEQLGELIEAPLITDAHRALRRCASPLGLNVKPSGAGGGDFSLVFGPADAAWGLFFDRLPTGLRHIPLRLGVTGVRPELTGGA